MALPRFFHSRPNGSIIPFSAANPHGVHYHARHRQRFSRRNPSSCQKEIKSNTSSTKGAVAQFRRDIAKLKRLVQSQQKEIAFLKTQEQKRIGQPQTNGEGELEGVRFSARSVKAQRKRLGLSAADFGKLVGVSGLTVYSWERDAGILGRSDSRPWSPCEDLDDVRPSPSWIP